MTNTHFVMRFIARVAPFLLLSFIAACGSDGLTACCTGGEPALRVVNAFTTPIDMLIDGTVAIESLAAGGGVRIELI